MCRFPSGLDLRFGVVRSYNAGGAKARRQSGQDTELAATNLHGRRHGYGAQRRSLWPHSQLYVRRRH